MKWLSNVSHFFLFFRDSTMEDEGVDTIVSSTKWAKWRTFLLFLLLQFLTHKNMINLKLKLSPCGMD